MDLAENKRPRGRPKGSYGSGMLRAEIRRDLASKSAEQNAGVGPRIGPGPRRSPRQLESSDLNDLTNESGQGRLFDLSLPTCLTSSQEMVVRQAVSQSACEPADLVGEEDNPAYSILFEGRRFVTSASVDKCRFTAGDLRRVAAAVVEGSGAMWCSLLNRIKHLLTQTQGQWKGLLLSVRRRYDETPLSLRVADVGVDAGESQSVCGGSDAQSQSMQPATSLMANSKRSAKVMQSEMHVTALLQSQKTQQCLQVTGKVPCWLQVLQTTRAEQISRCQQDIMSTIPNLLDLGALFDMRHMFVCTDRFSANLAAERDIQAVYSEALPKGLQFGLTHTGCQVHKLSTCEKAMAEILAGQVGGLVSLGMSMRSAGAVKELQEILFRVLSEELVVQVGRPTGEAHRKAVYDLFLPTHNDASTQVNEQDSKSRADSVLSRERRRAILDHYLNGDIAQKTIIHMSPVFRSRDEILEEMKRNLVPALICGACPVLNRGKWLGCETTFRWVGLLLTHHDLLTKIMVRWKGASNTVAAVPQSVATGEAPCGLGLGPRKWGSWAQAAVSAATAAANSSSAMHTGSAGETGGAEHAGLVMRVDVGVDLNQDDAFLPEPVQDPLTGDINWAEHNKASIAKAIAWLETKPKNSVILMSVCWDPVLRLMRELIGLGSQQWEHRQEEAASCGEERSYRVLEMYLGNSINRFQAAMKDLFHKQCDSLPTSAHLCHVRTLMFRLLSRSGSSVHHVFAREKRGAPYVLFGALWGLTTDVCGLPECLRDELTSWFLDRFTEDELSGQVCQNMLACAASQIDLDIVGIEVRHASVRRVNTVRSCQTWAMDVQDLSADFVARQMVILREPFSKSVKAQEHQKIQKKRPRTRTNPKKRPRRKRKSLGGPWRAFLLHKHQGEKITSLNSKRILRQYYAIKATGGTEWKFYKELGLSMTLAGRSGIKVKGVNSIIKTNRFQSHGCRLQDKLRALRERGKRLKEIADAEALKSAAAIMQASQAVQCNLASSTGLQLRDVAETPTCCPSSAFGNSMICLPGSANAAAILKYHVPADHLAFESWA